MVHAHAKMKGSQLVDPGGIVAACTRNDAQHTDKVFVLAPILCELTGSCQETAASAGGGLQGLA
jgi:hypothetical protein